VEGRGPFDQEIVSQHSAGDSDCPVPEIRAPSSHTFFVPQFSSFSKQSGNGAVFVKCDTTLRFGSVQPRLVDGGRGSLCERTPREEKYHQFCTDHWRIPGASCGCQNGAASGHGGSARPFSRNLVFVANNESTGG